MPLGKRLARRSNVGTSLARDWPASQLPQEFRNCLRTLIAIDAATKHISRQAKVRVYVFYTVTDMSANSQKESEVLNSPPLREENPLRLGLFAP
jgi:hypothetical protein